MAEPRRQALRGRALVWKRFDFRESSRIVALLVREVGLVHALAKGAHRKDSPLLGRIDFLSELDVQLSAPREGLRTLLRASLVQERRSLRASHRYLCASHFVEVADCVLPHEGADAELFDLIDGGLRLLERCPAPCLPTVVLGLELRLLQRLGSLPELDVCGQCMAPLADGAFHGTERGALACRAHAGAPRRAVSARALAFLAELQRQPGRAWADLGPPPPAAATLPGIWLAASLERRCRLRAHALGPLLLAVDSAT
jgi:DNA repair protein RecO (recombination protein O)